MLGVLRRCIREHGKARDALEQILRCVMEAVFANGASDRGLVALEERLVQIYFLPFFFAGVFVAAFGDGADAVPVMPSDSERLSSTSTVWVIVSLPFGAG